MTRELVSVLRAAETAARWHVHQRRKGAGREPYVNHLLEVAALVAEATAGEEPELVIAALLHDAIEDQKIQRSLIAEEFGETVTALVEEVTDDKTLDQAVRKRRQVETASRKSRRARILKLADKTSNLKGLAASPPAGWSLERRREYIRWARDVVAGLRGVSPWLESEFERAARDAERSVAISDPEPGPA